MFRLACSAAGDDRDADRLAHRGCNLQVVAILRAIGIHAGEDNLAGAEPLDLAGPRDGFEASRNAAAVDMNFVYLLAVARHALGVDVHDDALAAEAAGCV